MNDSITIQYWIYALENPNDGTLFYAGVSKQPEKRFKAHIGNRKNYHDSPAKVELIKQLKAEGKLPVMRILDSLKTDGTRFPYHLEDLWLAKLKAGGSPLLNSVISPHPSRSLDQEILRFKAYAELPKVLRVDHADFRRYEGYAKSFTEYAKERGW